MDTVTAFEKEVDRRVNALIEKGLEKASTAKLRTEIIAQVAREMPELYEAHRDAVAPKK